jgi:DNA-binding MarR family transcriptional regulator
MNKAVQLLIGWDSFEQSHPGAEIEDFCRYQLAIKSTEDKSSSDNRGLLLKIIGRIGSAFGLYHRAAMKEANLPSPESFYFLNGLAHLGTVKKTGLINYLFYEYTTGMEVINKLLGEQLISEGPDPNDKRARLIELTEKGRIALNESYAQSSKVSEMIFHDLDPDSVKLCIHLLTNIEEKHSRLVIELRNRNFEEMYMAICNDSQSGNVSRANE